MALLADEQKKVADDILAPFVNAKQNALDVVALKKKTEDDAALLAAL
jgi:hypothetical protein